MRDDWKHRETHLKSFKVLRKLRNTDFLQAVTLVASYNRQKSAIRAGMSRDKVPAIGCRRSDVLKLTTEEYQSWAEPITRGFEEAARFLHTQKIFDAKHLAYPIQLVAMAAILTVLGKRADSEQVRSRLARWLWSGMFGELYLRGEARAACDLVEIPLWLSGGAVPTTVTSARFSVERIINARKSFGAVYQGLSALLRLSGAVDWSTGEEINDVLYFEQGVESHHIFPVAWCRKYGIDPKKYNGLVNRTPLSAKTNKKIGSKAPSVYLKEFERSGTSPEKLDDMLRSHAIDPTMLRNDDIERFFTTRTKALMELISKAMGKPLTIDLFETCDQEYANEYANGNGNGFINH